MKIPKVFAGRTRSLNKTVELRKWVVIAGAVLILAVGALGALMVSPSTHAGPPTPGEETGSLFVAGAGNGAIDGVSFASGFAPIVKAALPSVVNISSSKVIRSNENDLGPFFNDPFFRDFFGDRFNIPRERRGQSLGSGVIVSPEGYIVTNNHVVDGATEVKVFLSDKRELKAKPIGADPKTDIAVLKIDEKNLPSLALGDSTKVQVGEFTLAIGNPFGVGQTVTMGIVSATGRSSLGIEDYEDFIQTDAAINPGNSGGALLNARGELIGINTAIISRAGGNQGVGFAIPSNLARNIMDQLVKGGKVVRGYLGVMIQEVTPALAKNFGLSDTRGALVADVTAGSPAAKAGLEKGDVITELNGEPVADSRGLRLKIAGMLPGATARLKLLHNSREREVTVTLGELPAELARGVDGRTDQKGTALEGVTVDDLTPQVARQLGIGSLLRGVVVTNVSQDSAAADAGLRRGDVIQEVNRAPVSSVHEFERSISQTNKKSVLLLVNRGGSNLYIAIDANS